MTQFDIAGHYDFITQLDRDVHDDTELSRTEVALAIQLWGRVPATLFLPMFGTGRHIRPWLDAGVRRIVGVDLSPRSVAIARNAFGDDPRIELHVGDLRTWRTRERFEGLCLLGNSFGDIVDLHALEAVTAAMCAPLHEGGLFVMDYIGHEYLDRCDQRRSAVWEVDFDGIPCVDQRTPRFDPETRIMAIDVDLRAVGSGRPVWAGQYQKRVFSDAELEQHLRTFGGIQLSNRGVARDLNPYYRTSSLERGMLACARWWTGIRVSG